LVISSGIIIVGYFWRFMDDFTGDIQGKDFHEKVAGTTIREYMLLNIG